MKLLGWMHRKFRQNNNEIMKDFSIGQPSLDDQFFYPKPTKPFRELQRDSLRRSFAGLDAAQIEADYEEEPSEAMSELFHGFLAIGTLGSDSNTTAPSTPTFAISLEKITEKETEATENELKLINDELEKVLGAEAKEDGYSDMSRRNSHVSTGRSSGGSTITLSEKPAEGLETNANGTTVFPLQGYLFGSSVELSETTKAAKKDQRTTLGELFQKTKPTEDNSGEKGGKENKRTEREADKSAVHIMKKMLKKRMLHAKNSTAAAGGNIDSTSAETKLHKMLHIFHRKVYPESTSFTEKCDKSQKYEKNRNSHDWHNNGGQMFADEDITIFPKKDISKDKLHCNKRQSDPPQVKFGCNDSDGNKEHWIKTDADYLVLEL